MVLAWENLWRFLFIFVHFVVVVVLHLSSFVDVFHFVGVVSLFDFQATLPCHRHSILASQTLEGLHQLWALPWLLSIAFFFHLPRALRFWVGIFSPQVFFTLHSFPTFLAQPNIFGTFPTFCHNLLLSRFYWEPAATFLKVSGLHTDPRNTDPPLLLFVLSFIHLKSVFIHVNIAKVLLVVKTLIRSAATLFSSHVSIKQQPNLSATKQ